LVWAATVSVGVAHAQDDATETPPPLEATAAPLELKFTPGVWIPRPTGDVRLSPGSFMDLDDNLDLRDRSASLNVELELNKRDTPWLLHFSGFDFDVDTSGTFTGNRQFGSLSLRDGDEISSDFEMLSVAGEVGYIMFDFYPDDPNVDMRIGPALAMRYVDFDMDVEQVGVGRETPSGDWLGVMPGVHFELDHDLNDGFPVIDRVVLRFGAGAGFALGGEGGTMYYLRAGVDLHFNDMLAFHFGFRLLEVEAETNDGFELDGGLQGLFIGGTLSF
jgi:hypothetical protein